MEFINGLQLNRCFFQDIVQPLLGRDFRTLRYAAGLLGHCSDVLGFDDKTSTDHVWGPRLQVFLSETDHVSLCAELDKFLSMELPAMYRDYPVNYRSEPGFFRWARPEYRAEPPFNHFVEIVTVRSFFNRDIQWDISRAPTIEEWLTFTDQALVELTSGEVFRDDLSELTAARRHLCFFPDPVWHFHMYCLWRSIAEEQAFPGRCHQVGDEIGWRLLAARIANKAMKLCFLLERRYFPYSKWFGSAFKQLTCASAVQPLLGQVLQSSIYKSCEEALCSLMVHVGGMHNALRVTPAVEPKVINCYGRGFLCMDANPFCASLRTLLEDSVLKGMNWQLLSKTVLYDDSNCDNSSQANRLLLQAARPSVNAPQAE